MKSLAAALIFLLVPTAVLAAGFDFYGVRFGNTKAEVTKVFNVEEKYGTYQAKDPGYSMSNLFFCFDNNDQLYRMEVYYILPSGGEERAALKEAVEEVVVLPAKKDSQIDVASDTYTESSRYGSATSLVVKIASKTHMEAYIDFLKQRKVEQMKPSPAKASAGS